MTTATAKKTAGPAPAPATLHYLPADGLGVHRGAVAEIGCWPGLDGTTRLVYLTLASAPGLPVDALVQVVGRSRDTVNGILGQLARHGLLDRPAGIVTYPRTGTRGPH